MRSRSIGFAGVLLTALVAACAPSTFDGLTGGKTSGKPIDDGLHNNDATPDPALKGLDPRPVSPFSGSWVNTLRPKFTWKLQEGTAGATVEMSRTADFTGDIKKFVGTGSEANVDKDLEPGMWFWRLQARSSEQRTGVSYGPTWSVLVRGKAKNQTKENTAAHGGLVDLDGNGVPDIVLSITDKEKVDATTQKDFTWALGVLSSGEAGKSPSFDPFDAINLVWTPCGTDAPSIAAGMDLDGDGFGDYVVADVFTPGTGGAIAFTEGDFTWGGSAMFPSFGAPYKLKPQDDPGNTPSDEDEGDDDVEVSYDDAPPPPMYVQPFTKPPVLAAGDFNGDGFGDVAALFSNSGMTVQGSLDGYSFSFLPFDVPGPTPPTSFTIAAGDFDGDGLSDIGYTPFDGISPLRLSKGDPRHYIPAPNLTVGSDITLPARATATTTGDFDGDGFDEVAFATTIGGKAAICVHSMASATLNAHGCWQSDAPVAGFATTLASGDADGDGVDEIFIGSTTGVSILAHAGVGYADDTSVFTATPVTGPYTSRLTVFYPGRPGKAQWAVYGADNKTLYVLEGKGENGALQNYDFTNLKNAQGVGVYVDEFGHFGTSIR